MHFFLKGIENSHDMNYLVDVPKGVNKIFFGKNEKLILQSSSTENELSKEYKDFLDHERMEILKYAPDNDWKDYWFYLDESKAPETVTLRCLNLKTNEVHEMDLCKTYLPTYE